MIKHVLAAKAKGEWVMVEMPGEDPARVKITTLDERTRGFVVLGFRHPTCGTVKKEYPRSAELVLAP